MTQPMGRKPYRSPWKTDHHLHEGHRKVQNWWEEDHDSANKAAAHREMVKEINDELNEIVDRDRRNSDSRLDVEEHLR